MSFGLLRVQLFMFYVLETRDQEENIESSLVWDTSCIAELIYDLVNWEFLCRNCPKPVWDTITGLGHFLPD